MCKSTRSKGFAAALLLAGGGVQGYELSENLSANLLAAAVLQCQILTRRTEESDACRGGAPVQSEFALRLTSADTLKVMLGIAAGDGLANVSPFVPSPWAADLRDDVRRINGTGRNYLLTAWWRHRFEPTPESGLAVSLGLIDATDFLDDNAYANNEYTQFMNEALVNGPNAFLPSYDPGAAVELEIGDWTVRGVAMQIGEDSDTGRFGFFGGQLAYRLNSRLGTGTYRILVSGTSEDVLDPDGNAKERRAALALSLDQELGRGCGGFLRLGWQDETAAAGYHAIYSGGIDVDGARWGRAGDNIGLAYAHLDGSGDGPRRTRVAEAYYRLALGDSFAITADLQYMRDEPQGEPAPEGLIVGTRFVAEF